VAVSPSGDLLVAGREDGSVAMWSEKGELQASMQVHEGPVRHIAFARAGLRVLTGSDDRTICAWDRTGRLVASHHGHHGGITKLLVAPGRGGFASASEDGTVRFWAWYGHEVFTRSEPGDPLTGVVPGPDDGSFVTWSDGVVRAWRPGATTPLPVARLPEGCRRWAAVAGAQGPFAALCAEGALVVDASGGRTEIPLPEGEAPSHTAFLPDGRGLLLAWPSGRVLVRPDAGPERVLSTETGVAVVAVSVSPDGALAAYGNAEGLVRVQDLEDGREVWSRRIGEAVNDVVLSPDGRRLAIAAAAAPVRVYSLDDDRRWPYADDLQDATAVRWDHGGASLLIGTPDGTMHRRNEAGDDLAIYRAPDGPLQAVAASADGRLVATLSRTGVFRVWHATAESLLQEARARPPRALTPAERARYQDVLPPRGGG
jgi:WD40 repeat protein